MDNQNKLYFPLFYKYSNLLSALTKEELGELIYAILISCGEVPPKEALDSKLEVIYKLMVNDASRLFLKNVKKPCGEYKGSREKQPQKMRYGDFDVEEAFQKALARSYAHLDSYKTL